jgi:hypothetical protein
MKQAPIGGEKYGRGRRKAGVTGTSGVKRRGNAEKTIHPGQRDSEGGGEGELGGTARSLYGNALRHATTGKRRGPMGDQAMYRTTVDAWARGARKDYR